MKKLVLVGLFIYLFSCISIYAQQSYGGTPLSFTHKNLTKDVDRIIVPQPDMSLISIEDQAREKNGELFRVGVVIDVDINMNNSGTWDILDDGTKIWRLRISCKDAQALTLLYSHFYLPEGSQLFLYNENRRQVLGSFDNRNNPIRGTEYSTQMVQGETTWLEYIQYPHVTEQAVLNISGIVYNYRNVESFVGYYKNDKPTGFGQSGSCNVNINCPEGANWQTEKRGVAEIYVIDGWSAGFCSGTLVNNTAQDGKPYFLTADHCGGTVSAANLNQWQFYFHFEASGCSNPSSEPSYQTIIGATFRARGPESGGSDFLLIELNTTAANIAAINGYYNGWDRSTTASPSGVGIHHPSGDIKKISTYTSPLQTATYTGCLANAHWKADWVQTATNWGITEGGSSGSPLFNGVNKLVVGTLTGGSSACGVPASQANDLYGKFSIHWETNGTTNDRRLRPWLDPQGTNPTTLPGYDPNATAGDPPVADFVGNPTTVTAGGTVSFTDLSTNNPTSWSWSFPGGTPNSSTQQNPTITYNTPGTYSVTLTATNAHGNDQEVKNNYITVVSAGSLVADFVGNPTNINPGETVSFTDMSVGNPTSWSWTFQGGTPATSTQQNPTVTYPNPGVYSVTLTISDGTNNDTKVRSNYITVAGGSGGDLVANFVASSYNIIAGQCINFTDLSTGNPTSWAWSFPGATPLSSTNQNPSNICYNTPGMYDVVLQVQNATTQNTYICSQCITVIPDPNAPVADFEADRTVVPVGGVVRFTNTSQNGPFNQWAWTFEGGTPGTYNDSVPPPIAYMTVGTYDVELRCRKTNGVQDVELKQNYIKVVPRATTPPTANFAANYTVITPGESVNFIDLSSGTPYTWQWTFQGGTPSSSTQVNPMGIVYNTAGQYSVTLRVTNEFGEDVMTKEAYIIVSETDPCTEAPQVAFTANPRLIPVGESVKFQDLSTGLPTYHTWSFPGGTPSYSNEGTPTEPIYYNTAGIYNVGLTVNNSCGATTLTKPRYIYVFSGPVQAYCDTITTISPNEVIEPRVPPSTWGFIAGQNGDRITAYANYYHDYTFSEIRRIIVPVKYAVYGSYTSYVRFTVWDGNTPTPQNILGEKKVYIRDLVANQNNVITFDSPVSINGPFYLGYTLNYPDSDNDGFSDDRFVVGIAAPRGTDPANNTLYLKKSNNWYTCTEFYGYSSSLPLKPVTCLVDIEDFIAEYSITLYPNPAKDKININISDENIINPHIFVYDALGRKLNVNFVKNSIYEYSADVSGLPEGIYFVKIYTDNLVINKKLLLVK
ncbi:MAG TPA: PKD domain-containing protein [Bacteroidales bacterium]|nr:PKD domain-containing protein [Bacteroidales bacterium]